MVRVSPFVCIIALAACADTGDEGMYVYNNTAASGSTCSFTGDPGQAFISHGEIYATSSTGYLMHPLIQSRLQAASGSDPIQSTVQLRGADVTVTLKAVSIQHADKSYTVTQPETTVSQHGVLFSGALPPAGYVNVSFEAIPPSVIASVVGMSGANLSTEVLRAEITANLVIRGDLNGDNVVSSPFLFPITICNDCIFANAGPCPYTGDVNIGNPCNGYQDGTVTCCEELDGTATCPARKM